MPNWIEGTMKLRGKREDIKRFLDNELEASSYLGEQVPLEKQVECDSDASYFEYTFTDEPHIKRTRRAFITSDYLYMDADEGTACVNIKQAWGFSKKRDDDSELDIWMDNAHKYNIDIKLYGIECGMEFCQEVIALKDSDKVINNVIQYADWEWECPFSNMGRMRMDKGCGTCAHAGTPTYKSPCGECVASGTFSGWTARSCGNCKHQFLLSNTEPCKSCFTDKGYNMWKRMLTDAELSQTAEQQAESKPDPIRPTHYTECSLECYEVMLAVFGRKAVTDFCILNAFKYMWRYEHKNGLEDLQKAERYLAMAGDFQMADKEQENRIINMKAMLEVLMRRANK